MKKIQEVAARIGITDDQLLPYGHYKAKVIPQWNEDKIKKGKLILVTAISPNKAGVGKTTTSVALSMGMNRIGKKAALALREPSLGPCFGMKGGATGGGRVTVEPSDDINLHFNGDFHAITSANNTLAALVDNYNFYTKGLPHSLRQVLWKRVLDVNDRSLRNIITGLDGNGNPGETGFDITAASEIMAIFSLAKDMDDLRRRIDNILLGYTNEKKPFYVKDLRVGGAITALLKDALLPNLVQDVDGGPAFVHGGPFANIAHGCNSIIATRMALQYGDYAITEAGFGADLGAEKFMNIKCRVAGLQPALSVLVATTLSLKLHGGALEGALKQPNMDALKKGMENLDRHLDIMLSFGQTVVVAINRFISDTDEEIAYIRNWCAERGVKCATHSGFADGAAGVEELATLVVNEIETNPSKPLINTYAFEDSIETKLTNIVTRVYKGTGIVLSKKAESSLRKINETGLNSLPVCIAKTQYTFSADAGDPHDITDFFLPVEDLVINTGAGFIVAVCGEMMRMPGLPKEPQALHIDVVNGQITGVSDPTPVAMATTPAQVEAKD
ncbi:MAG TPA: formate--tetrahydrofolate ligase [Bacteroidia bacterium]|nr:formate--tetrahydrofolate ligase [Bacteroidia bacterium]